MTYKSGYIDDLDGIYRSLRRALGVEAFGLGALVLPPGTEQVAHFHHRQDEVYFVHRGRAGFRIGEEEIELGEGGMVHVPSTTPRNFWNAGEDDLVLVAIGAAGGLVDEDAELVDPDDATRLEALLRGDADGIRRR